MVCKANLRICTANSGKVEAVGMFMQKKTPPDKVTPIPDCKQDYSLFCDFVVVRLVVPGVRLVV